MVRQIKTMALAVTLLLSAASLAKIELPAVFESDMVLQRNTSVNIWGQASPGAKVAVSGSCMVYPIEAQADNNGKWKATFKTKGAGGPYTLTIKDKSDNAEVTLENILCGEVWLCSGQSNMEWSVGRSDNAEAEIAQADYPNIRLFHIPKTTSPNKEQDVNAKWEVCSPETIPSFTAVGYFFGRSLHKELDIPVGLIESAWGGSIIEAWIPTVGYEGLDRLDNLAAQVEEKTPGSEQYQQKLREAIAKVDEWKKEAVEAMREGRAANDLPGVSLNLPQGNHGIQGLYNAMIHPIVPYTIKGAIWYQGESNRLDGMLYYEKMKALIGGWREIWNQGDFPFYYVHLAPYRYNEDQSLQLVWEAQLKALDIPNTGMAVTNDVGNYTDIHPRNKQDVGKRLALWALAKDYGKSELVYSGPIYDSVKFTDGKALVKFDHAGSGLTTRDGKSPDWFEIAGEDGKFYEAQAEITDKDTVTVWSDEVESPGIVRMGWDKGATPNLMNKEGLPSPAFSSDIESRLLPEGENYALNKPYTCSDENKHGTSWKQGLTNGSWAEDSLNCFASNEGTQFPKYATIDLEEIQTISKVYLGVPAFGSTKTIQVQISKDGKEFSPAGQYVFSLNKSEKTLISFKPRQARYVRLTYPDHYSEQAGYNPNFVFTTEVEVYGK